LRQHRVRASRPAAFCSVLFCSDLGALERAFAARRPNAVCFGSTPPAPLPDSSFILLLMLPDSTATAWDTFCCAGALPLSPQLFIGGR
jgi:hypothetical protein